MASVPRDYDRQQDEAWDDDDIIELGPVLLPFPTDEPVILPFALDGYGDDGDDELIDIDPTKPLPPLDDLARPDPWDDIPW